MKQVIGPVGTWHYFGKNIQNEIMLAKNPGSTVFEYVIAKFGCVASDCDAFAG